MICGRILTFFIWKWRPKNSQVKNTWKGKYQNYAILYLYIIFSSNKNMLKLFKQEKEVTDVENKDKLK